MPRQFRTPRHHASEVTSKTLAPCECTVRGLDVLRRRRSLPLRSMTIVFDNDALLPDAWRSSAGSSALRIFNPTLLRDSDGWLFAYRVVAEPELRRRIAICRLDESIRVISGSPVPYSDEVTFPPNDYAPQALTWFADPRLYRLHGRVFIYWNSGWHEPQNYQFLQEVDPATLRPTGAPRELTLRGTRQKLEKNWMLFESDGGPFPAPSSSGTNRDTGLYAVYSVHPHRILTFSLVGVGPIEFSDAAPPTANPGGYAQVHGGLRGGAPPQRSGMHFYSFCHSIENGTNGYEYVPAVYRFSTARPFLPTDMPIRPLTIDLPTQARRALPKLNSAVADVIYPAGAAFHDGKWAVSFGIDDERCAIALLDDAEVTATLGPVR